MSSVISIDPGTEQSAFIHWNGYTKRVLDRDTCNNFALLQHIDNLTALTVDNIVIEGINSYGMPVGREIFATCYWIGRFWQKALDRGMAVWLVSRQEIKVHHCGSARAKDSNLRQALLDKYGPQGTKKEPGVTYGLSKHLWSAFAIATWYTETKQLWPAT